MLIISQSPELFTNVTIVFYGPVTNHFVWNLAWLSIFITSFAFGMIMATPYTKKG